MWSPIIRVANLGKKYVLDTKGIIGKPYRRLSEDLVEAIKRPFCKAGPSANGRLKKEEFWALHNVSFEVGAGEVIGIIGRNGAGKSTLLKVLSRITEPSQGRVCLSGRVASLLEVGTGFHPELTGRENIFLNGAVLGMTGAEVRRKFDEIVAFAEAEKFLETPVKHYSSGMYMRLAFAVAAHLQPEILLVDEVLAVGDAQFQKKCLGKMSEVSHGGRTVLFVSHNMAVVQALCQRAIWLDHGALEFDGPVLETISQYLGSAPIDDEGKRRIQFVGSEDRVRLRDLIIRSPEWSATGKVPCNGRVEILLLLEVLEKVPYMHFELQLRDRYGAKKTSISSREHACADLGQVGAYEIRIEIPAFPATPGVYDWYLELCGDLFFHVPLVKYERLCPFEVLARNMPGAGYPYEAYHGDYVVDGTISVSCNGSRI